MSAKAYLQSIEKMNAQIEYKQREVESLRDLLLKITGSIEQDRVQNSMNYDKTGDTIAKIVDLQNEINSEIDALVDRKREIIQLLDEIDPKSSCLLYKRYFEFKTWEQIAVEMGYSYRQVTRLHGKALKDVLECPIASVI